MLRGTLPVLASILLWGNAALPVWAETVNWLTTTGTFSELVNVNIALPIEVTYFSDRVRLQVVPAPHSVAVLAMGLTGLGIVLRRRK